MAADVVSLQNCSFAPDLADFDVVKTIKMALKILEHDFKMIEVRLIVLVGIDDHE